MDKDTKLNIVKQLRHETGMGMMDLTKAFDVFLEALKYQPHAMDVGHRLKFVWEPYDMRKPEDVDLTPYRILEYYVKSCQTGKVNIKYIAVPLHETISNDWEAFMKTRSTPDADKLKDDIHHYLYVSGEWHVGDKMVDHGGWPVRLIIPSQEEIEYYKKSGIKIVY